jgi:hypothetical protein
VDELGAAALDAPALAELVHSYGPLLALQKTQARLDAEAEPHLLAAPGVTREAASWACWMVRTRAFELGRSSTDACVLAFIPWLDMINHSCDEPNCDWSWDSLGARMVITALRPLRAGEEATVSYGERDNDAFLLWGGFVLNNNQHDSVEAFASLEAAAVWWVDGGVGVALGASVSIAASDAIQLAHTVDHAARTHAAADGTEALRQSVCIGPGWQVDERLIDLLEALAAQELGKHAAERGAIAAVRLRAEQLLAAAPTSVSEDAVLAAGLQGIPRACVQYRAAKKRILESYV